MNSHDHEDRRMTTVITAEPTAPGGWLAAVIPGRLAVVHHPEPDAVFAARLWAALNDEDGIRHVLDELARNGLTSVPGFVLAEWDDAGDAFDGRFIVRGGAGVAVETGSGDEDITANGVSTWVERPVSGVRGFRIECAPAQLPGGTALPFIEGVAWVSALSFGSAAESYDEASRRPSTRRTEEPGASTRTQAVPAPAAAAPGTATTEPADPVPATPVEDLDRTIADLEVTVAGEDAAEPSAEPATVQEPAAQEPAVLQQPATGEPDAAQASAPEVPHETTAYDHLFGATMLRSVEDAAARPDTEDGEAAVQQAPTVIPPLPPVAPAAAAAPAQQPAMLGDHDGLTVLSGDLKAMREASAHAAGAAADAPSEAGATVDEDRGFTLQLPDGRTEPIDGMVVVGRAPSVSKMGGGRVPRLVTVDSAEHDISRNHVQLTVEGGTVVVTDLHSRNGTLIALPGKSAQKLRAGEPTSVIAGTVIDLGSGVTLGVVPA